MKQEVHEDNMFYLRTTLHLLVGLMENSQMEYNFILKMHRNLKKQKIISYTFFFLKQEAVFLKVFGVCISINN